MVVPADPRQGMSYREEYYADAEDAAEVLNVGSQVQVPYRRFKNALLTRNFSSLEDFVEEMKLYARDVGPVMESLVGRLGAHGAAQLRAVGLEVLVGEQYERDRVDSRMPL